MTNLKPWREVATPHRDVLEGHLQESEFAADLTKVVAGTAPPEYQDPALFFERTYITEGMALLLDGVLKRLSGHGGDPVVQLKTAFGGGKTHTMKAVYHVAGRGPRARPAPACRRCSMPPGSATAAGARGGARRQRTRPLAAAQHGTVEARTLWGELACQLGGEEGYALVADADRTAPRRARRC